MKVVACDGASLVTNGKDDAPCFPRTLTEDPIVIIVFDHDYITPIEKDVR